MTVAFERPSCAAMSLARSPAVQRSATLAAVDAGRWCDRKLRSGEPGVLLAGRIGEGDELVHLEERARWLGHLDTHPSAAGRVALEVSVVDGLVEDRGEAGGELADHGGPEWSHSPPAAVSQHRAGLDRAPELRGLLELVGLEREAQVAVDLVEPVLAEERQQMVGQARAVVGLGVRADRPVTEDPVDLRLQPGRGVLVERRNAAALRRAAADCACARRRRGRERECSRARLRRSARSTSRRSRTCSAGARAAPRARDDPGRRSAA